MKLGLCFLLFLSLSINSLSSAEDAPLPTGRRLRVIVTEKFPAGNVFIGAAAHGASVQKQAGLQSALNREFSYVTPANDFKQSYILPNPESAWKWDLPEWWLKQAARNGQLLRVHGCQRQLFPGADDNWKPPWLMGGVW